MLTNEETGVITHLLTFYGILPEIQWVHDPPKKMQGVVQKQSTSPNMSRILSQPQKTMDEKLTMKHLKNIPKNICQENSGRTYDGRVYS